MKEIGSEFSHCTIEDYYFSRIKDLGKAVRFLRCGRDAIGYVADLLDKKSGVLLMPAYCCDSMIQPFVIRGWKIEYYPINKDFSVDINFVVSTFEKSKPDAIVLMNFFGLTDTSEVISIAKTKCKNIQIIEDITHTLFDIEKTYSSHVDYYIGSIRKWMGITDGAIVISTKNDIPNITFSNSNFIFLRSKALNLKEEYLHTNSPSIKLMYRKILSEAENSLENGKTPYLISPSSQITLDHLNCESLKNSRKWNASVLLELLKTIPEIKLPENINNILERIPFSIPIFVKDRDIFQKRMANKGIYASVLWPLNPEAREKSAFAGELETTMLSIPIDQRYNAEDMKLIYKVIRKTIKE